MSAANTIEFVLRDKVNGVDLTPQTIGLSRFNEFNQQVEAFIAGSQKLKLDEAHVEVRDGSYKLRVAMPVEVSSAVENDVRLLAREDSLGEIDPRRAEIVSKWQARSKDRPELNYEILPATPELPRVRISRATDFRVGEIVPWISVEKYLFGTIMDMGGAQKANIHLKVDELGRTLLIGASQGYLREQIENRLYHKVLAHVRAEQHFRTGALRNLQLIAFVDYAPQYDEAALDRFAEKGREAWADVPDAAQWVRELRGGT